MGNGHPCVFAALGTRMHEHEPRLGSGKQREEDRKTQRADNWKGSSGRKMMPCRNLSTFFFGFFLFFFIYYFFCFDFVYAYNTPAAKEREIKMTDFKLILV
jgi:hypothetical protein